ncbi:MAG: hypothetical protein KGZ85_11475 [Ignavibacterium sp.]|nr:hypothetical protein [Ignavibacterium sp.]
MKLIITKLVADYRILVILVLPFLTNSCFEVPDDLIVPRWSVDLNLPIVNQEYTIDELLKDDTKITIDTVNGKSIYILQSDTYELDSDIGEFISLDSESSLQNIPLPASNTDSAILYIELPEGVELDSAFFEQGILAFSVNNPSLYTANISLHIPGILTPAGEKLIFNMTALASGRDSVFYNLINHSYKVPAGQPQNRKNSFQIIARVTSAVPEQTFVFASYYLNDFAFQCATGFLPPKLLGSQIETYKFNLDSVNNYQNNITLKEASLRLAASYISPASNPIGVEIYNLTVMGKRNNGEQFYLLDSAGNIYHSIKFYNEYSEKIYTEQNSNINEFIAFLPDTVILISDYLMNPDNKRGTATNEDVIKIETDFSTKSYFTLNNINIKDYSTLEMNGDDRWLIRNNSYGVFTIEIDNSIPLGIWLKLDLRDQNNNFLFTITKDSNGIDSVYFQPAVVDANGEVISSQVNPPLRITLNSEQIQLLSNSYNVNYSISVSTSNINQSDPPTVAIRPSAGIKIRSYGSISFEAGN